MTRIDARGSAFVTLGCAWRACSPRCRERVEVLAASASQATPFAAHEGTSAGHRCSLCDIGTPKTKRRHKAAVRKILTENLSWGSGLELAIGGVGIRDTVE